MLRYKFMLSVCFVALFFIAIGRSFSSSSAYFFHALVSAKFVLFIFFCGQAPRSLPLPFFSPVLFLFAHWTTNLYRSLGSWMTNHRWICIKFRFVFVVVLNCTQCTRTQTQIYVLWSSDFIAFFYLCTLCVCARPFVCCFPLPHKWILFFISNISCWFGFWIEAKMYWNLDVC